VTAVIPTQRSADQERFDALVAQAHAEWRAAKAGFRCGTVDDIWLAADQIVRWFGSELTLLLGEDAPNDPEQLYRLCALIVGAR
jgi:hypothetical protein